MWLPILAVVTRTQGAHAGAPLQDSPCSQFPLGMGCIAQISDVRDPRSEHTLSDT
jgi:hypothetical protein